MTSFWQFGDGNESKLTADTARFFFDQAERMLESTNTVKEHLTSTAFNLIALFAPIVLALTAYAVHAMAGFPARILANPAALAASATALYLVVPLMFSLCAALPKAENFNGSEPKKLMTPYFCSKDMVGERQSVAAFVCECENYQRRIEENLLGNSGVAKSVRCGVIMLTFSPAFAVAAYASAVIFF